MDWSIESKPEPILNLRWSERGNPVLAQATKFTGFGTLLIERTMKSITGGEARMHTDTDGVSWEIALDLPRSDKLGLRVRREACVSFVRVAVIIAALSTDCCLCGQCHSHRCGRGFGGGGVGRLRLRCHLVPTH